MCKNWGTVRYLVRPAECQLWPSYDDDVDDYDVDDESKMMSMLMSMMMVIGR